MALTLEQLQERASKVEVKIQKLEKKVLKYRSLISNEFEDLVNEYLQTNDISKIRSYNQLHYNNNYSHGDEAEYYYARLDLNDKRNTLNKYLIKIEEIKQFESEKKIEVIWNFLTEWEEKTYNWYIQNANLYMELYDKYNEAWENSKEAYKYESTFTSYDGSIITRVNYKQNRFKEKYYFNIQSLTKEITNVYRKTIDTEELAKVIKDEKEHKYKELIERVTKITGKITDASMLKIGNQHGEINGMILGEKGKCIIETISAGGYNIQCFHYRVLLKEVK